MHHVLLYVSTSWLGHIPNGTAREDALKLRGLMEVETKRNTTKRKVTDPDGIHEVEMRKAEIRSTNSFKFVSCMASNFTVSDHQLQHYAEDKRTCRHIAICQYFGERIDSADKEMLRAYCDGMCDVSDTFLSKRPHTVHAHHQG